MDLCSRSEPEITLGATVLVFLGTSPLSGCRTDFSHLAKCFQDSSTLHHVANLPSHRKKDLSTHLDFNFLQCSAVSSRQIQCPLVKFIYEYLIVS